MRQVKALHTLMQSIERSINNTATPIVTPTEQAIRYITAIEQAREWEQAHPFQPRVSPWGVTMQEAADALTAVFGRPVVQEHEPIGDSSDGIAPCGYDAL